MSSRSPGASPSARAQRFAAAADDGEPAPQHPFDRVAQQQLRSGREPAVVPAQQIGRSREQRLLRPVEAAPPLLQQPLALLCESRAEPFQSDRRRMRDRQRRISQLQSGPRQIAVGLRHPFDEPRRHGRRRFERRMRHQIGDARILVVPDARHHRQRKLRHVVAQAIGVETVQVARRPAAADHHHGIERLPGSGDAAERVDDRIFGRRALHDGVEERETEAVGAFSQFVAEILIPGRTAARHHGDALHDGRHRLLPVHLPHPFGLQAGDGLLPLPLHVAQRVGRIDVEQLQREAVEFVVVHRRFGQYAHAGGEPLPRLGLEIGGDARVLRPPDHGARLRFGNAVALPPSRPVRGSSAPNS